MRSFAHSAILAAIAVAVSADNLTPNYEVKLLMDPTKVLDSSYKLIPSVLSTFAMPTSVTKMNVQFLDTDNKDMYSAGWSLRVRKTEGSSDFELNYKKRYSISNDDIDGSLTQAANDGFDSSSTWGAQVEWGYQQKALSISKDKTGSGSGYSGQTLPGQSASQQMLKDNAPDKFNDWISNGWGKAQISNSRIYGPIAAKRSIGTWNGNKLYIEVWPIKSSSGSGTDYIVEASFKVDARADASSGHDQLQALLQQKGWFLAQDSLKTSLIMQRY